MKELKEHVKEINSSKSERSDNARMILLLDKLLTGKDL